MTSPFTPITDEDEERAITRLVDGALTAAEHRALEEWARQRPDVQRRIARQRRVVGELEAGGPEVPRSLVQHIQGRVDATYGTHSARRRPRFGRVVGGWRLAIPAIVAATAAALAIVLFGGGTPGPSITRAAELAYAAPTSSAPAPQSSTHLDVSYGGVIYPNYERQFRAAPTGQLRNRIGGRPALTVFYRLSDGTRLSYTVIAGKPVPPPGVARVVEYDGVALRVFNTGKLAVVTLVRHGRTCVLAAETSQDVVIALAEAPLRVQQV